MSETEAAWVRANAWTGGLRRIEDAYPRGYHRWCDCERGVCAGCLAHQHEQCVSKGGPRPRQYLTSITDAGGFIVDFVIYRDDQTPCRWICPCTHETTRAEWLAGRRRARRAAEQLGEEPPETTELEVEDDQGALFETLTAIATDSRLSGAEPVITAATLANPPETRTAWAIPPS